MTVTSVDPDCEYVPCVYCQQYRDQITSAQHQGETALEAVLHEVLHLHWQEKHAGPRRLHAAPDSRPGRSDSQITDSVADRSGRVSSSDEREEPEVPATRQADTRGVHSIA
ncbi:hypothetical protein [Streptomyces sp. NPDC006784]|uniref:hypothetical protein n=1 Tax=Streptomyces sp. NPDC006784 TaxID=3364764 RepID=UPI0036CBE206